MYDEDELMLLDVEVELESPLDRLEPLTAESEEPKLNPEAMLALLEHAEPQQRMLASRAFCDIEDARATPHLIQLLTDTCPLVRVSAAYGIGHNPSPDAVQALIDQLNRDWNGYVRKGIVWWALGNCPRSPMFGTSSGRFKNRYFRSPFVGSKRLSTDGRSRL